MSHGRARLFRWFVGLILTLGLIATGTPARACRQESVRRTIAESKQAIPDTLGTLSDVASVDLASIPSMDAQQAAAIVSIGLPAYTESSGLAAPFSHSDAVEAGNRWPDFSQDIATARTVEPKAFLNIIAAYDRLGQLGIQPPMDLTFPEALHMMAGGASLPVTPGYKLNALAPWDPYYARQPIVTEYQPRQEGSVLFTDQVQRTANSPEEYLRAIGFDPGLAAKIGPLIKHVRPGQYLATARQLFSLLNPQFASSPLGQLLSKL